MNDTQNFRRNSARYALALTIAAFSTTVLGAHKCVESGEPLGVEALEYRVPSFYGEPYPYEGYAPTGYKGSMERDHHWFQLVRKIKLPNGEGRYVLKRQPATARVQYESIVPVAMGGGRMGVVAYREGCGNLLYADGTPAVAEVFSAIEDDSYAFDPTTRKVRYRLTYSDAGGSDYAYVVFENGRLSAVSPRRYVGERSNTILAPAKGASTEMSKVEVEGGAQGVIDLWTLREILQPEWQEIHTFSVAPLGANRKGVTSLLYFVARKDAAQVFESNGAPVALPRFDKLDRIGNLFLPVKTPGGPDPDTIFALDERTRTCRLYSPTFRPLLQEPIPASKYFAGPGWDICDMSRWWNKKKMVFTGVDGRTRVYEKRLVGSEALLIKTFEMDEELAFRVGDTMVLKSRQGPLPYWLVDEDGKAVPGARFEAIRPFGCGNWAVKRDGAWWQLLSDGKLVPPTYSFSC